MVVHHLYKETAIENWWYLSKESGKAYLSQLQPLKTDVVY